MTSPGADRWWWQRSDRFLLGWRFSVEKWFELLEFPDGSRRLRDVNGCNLEISWMQVAIVRVLLCFFTDFQSFLPRWWSWLMTSYLGCNTLASFDPFQRFDWLLAGIDSFFYFCVRPIKMLRLCQIHFCSKHRTDGLIFQSRRLIWNRLKRALVDDVTGATSSKSLLIGR